MKTILKGVLGWDQRTEAKKFAVRRFLIRPYRALECYLGSALVSFLPTPLSFKRKLAWLYLRKANTDVGLGANSSALQAAWCAADLCPELEVYMALSEVIFPGEWYHYLLQRFHDWLQPKSYIEIGVRTGESITLAKPPTVVVGIDPDPRLLTAPRTVCKIFPLTSDDYFSGRDPRRDIEAETVDLAFIDGFHLFEQTLRDFINIERLSSSKTLVLIHDTFALDAFVARRELSDPGRLARPSRLQNAFCTGDVWKIIPCLREFRPDLHVFTIATPPSGLSVVTRLDSRSTVLIDHFDEIVSRYALLELEPNMKRRKESAAMVPNNWPEIVAQLSSERDQAMLG